MLLFLKYRMHSLVFLLLGAVYIAQVTLVKPNEVALKKYDITATDARLLALSIAIPYILIWLIALMGYLRLKTYTDAIKKGIDYPGFRLITLGVLWLALWLPLSTILNNEVVHIYEARNDLVVPIVRLNNYLNLFLLFPGFVYVFLGSRKLTNLAKTTIRTPNQLFVLFYIAFAAIYTLTVLNDPVKREASGIAIKATYYMPDWLIVSTIVIPRLIMWYLGFHAVQNIFLYRHKIKGTLYKVALHKFAFGLCVIVVASIVLRVFQSSTSQLGRLSLTAVFILLYLILIMLTSGFIWMSTGAKKLLYIENL